MLHIGEHKYVPAHTGMILSIYYILHLQRLWVEDNFVQPILRLISSLATGGLYPIYGL